MTLFTVVTTIQPVTPSMETLAQHLGGLPLIVVGDEQGPTSYDLPNTKLLGLRQQQDYALGQALKTRSYARKNIGYLEAMQHGASCIYETDDDNAPMDSWRIREEQTPALPTHGSGAWVNVYRAFTHEHIWPRGFPLELSMDGSLPMLGGFISPVRAPIQQGLANGSPDVDAVWRMTLERPFTFEQRPSVLVTPHTWSPFNSQTTWWWPDAYPLMYLPTHCSFRVCDIWRSFVAQRCLWEQGLGVVYHAPEVFQDRNEHDPHADFASEWPAYLNNANIARTLSRLPLTGDILSDIRKCYEALVVGMKLFPEEELELLDLWLEAV